MSNSQNQDQCRQPGCFNTVQSDEYYICNCNGENCDYNLEKDSKHDEDPHHNTNGNCENVLKYCDDCRKHLDDIRNKGARCCYCRPDIEVDLNRVVQFNYK